MAVGQAVSSCLALRKSVSQFRVSPYKIQVLDLLAPKRWGRRQVASFVLISMGAGLTSYVGTAYARMYGTQRELLREWSASQNSASKSNASGLTRIYIPKIKLDDVVVEGVSSQSLSRGPGHMQSSAMPGEAGNAVLAGHRDTFFRNLNRLGVGDDIFVERSDQQYRYVVTGRRVVAPSDVKVLQATSGSRLTLITCYPIRFIGRAPKRLIVSAKLAPIGSNQEASVLKTSAHN